MTKRPKKTPEQEAAFREFRRQAHARERRLRELVDKGLAELEALRAREQHTGT